jgi:hypothetical protein
MTNTEKKGPSSFFFVEHEKLALASASNDDAFGPSNITNNIASKYRTTSFVRALNDFTTVPIKVFAICDGQILILPQTNNPDKVNFILKPTASYAPIKIKYFIYRGVNKADLTSDNTNLKPVNELDPSQPELLKELWEAFKKYNTSDPNTSDPTDFTLDKIGYTLSNLQTTPIDAVFNQTESNICQLPICSLGMHLGYFTGRIGLDIVLDYGTSEADGAEEDPFKLDLNFAQLEEHVFDVSNVTNNNAVLKTVKQKRYKEHIHQFLDAAAFWGSHINCGTITMRADNDIVWFSPLDIYKEILTKYQTGKKLYLYIQDEYGKSYNYYNTSRTIYGFVNGNINGIVNETSGWPILIKEINQDQDSTYNRLSLSLRNLSSQEVNMDIDFWAFNSKITDTNPDSKYPKKLENHDPYYWFSISLPTVENETSVVRTATFCMIFINVNQGSDYYNYLWPANIKNSISIGNDIKYSCFTFDKNRMVNLDILSCGAALQNKVVCEQEGTMAGRRLYMAIIKSNTKQDARTNSLNIYGVTEGFKESITTKEKYFQAFYNVSNFSMLKGQSGEGANDILSLAFTNETNPLSVKSYFQLGITEQEYQALKALLSSSNGVRCNAFFYLDKENIDPAAFQKFKLGIKYEDENGSLSNPVYPTNPTNANEYIYVYTLDGFFFFSSEFASKQNFTEEPTYCKATFKRSKTASTPYSYYGEFGFDWMRLGNPGISGDVNYRENIGKLYTNTTPPQLVENEDVYIGNFIQSDTEFYKLEQEYDMYFMLLRKIINGSSRNIIEKYYIPQLTLYPKYEDFSNTPERNPAFGYSDIPENNNNFKSFCNRNRVARLILEKRIYDNSSNNSEDINLEYDKTLFDAITYKPNTSYISIRCSKTSGFESDQLIRATVGDKLVGCIRVKANSKPNRYSKKVLVIGVITNITDRLTGTVWNRAKQEHLKALMMFLRQVLITPIIETVDDISLDTDTANDAFFFHTEDDTTYVLNKHGTNSSLQKLEEYLFTKVPNYQNYNNNGYFKIFLFDTANSMFIRPDGSTDKHIGGFSNKEDKIVVFTSYDSSILKLHNQEMCAHEFLHTAKVKHTFANNSPHTFNPLKTENIMDYSNLNESTPIPMFSIFNWQGAIAQKHIEENKRSNQ